jgi:ABC-2 type transport system permease protein
MSAVLAVEWLKLRRSTVLLLSTALMLVAVPGAAVGSVAMARTPGLDGPSAAKLAQYAVGELHATQVAVAGQVLAVAMSLGGGFLVAWVYGREFADRTVGSLFALPVSRRRIALAKAALATAWLVVVPPLAVGLTALVSWAVHPAGFDVASVLPVAAVAAASGVLAGLLTLPFGWVATVTRGYMGALAALVGVTVVTQVAVTLGSGAWFPFAAPGLWSGMGGPDAAALVRPAQLLLVPVIGAVGVALTARRWQRMRLATS